MDVFTGKCYFDTNEQANSATIAAYFADVAAQYEAAQIKKVVVFMDNNPTHKEKMQALFRELTSHSAIEVVFRFISTYSPKLNLVEYGIHKIRQKVLHHADCKLNLVDLKARIGTVCEEGVFTCEQIANILTHIQLSVPNKVN